MDKLPEAIRKAATDQGISIEQLRKKTGLSNGRFYELLKGLPPKKIDALDKLEAAGVAVPGREKAKGSRKGRSKAA